jgi:glycosyltransferase involved in cell wall biosynthesis
MKVAFCIRANYDNPMGGDVIQMLKTKDYLEKNYDVEIVILTNANGVTADYDLVHVFNFSTYDFSIKFIEKAVEENIPIVSSPIYWDYSYASTGKLFYFLKFSNRVNEKTINVLKKIVQLIGLVIPKPIGVSKKFRRKARWMFDNSNIIAPNSIEEGRLLLKWMKIKDTSDKIRVVYNATDMNKKKVEIEPNEEEFLKKYGIPKDYILQVGRIEFCKNQLNLIAALMDNPEIPIVFVGKIFDQLYYKKLRKIAVQRGNVYFIDAVPYSEIAFFFQFARLHVLLSLRESPGLVNIEALANDCPIVISDERFLPVKTYFPNQPYVVNPLDISAIRRNILDAYRNRVLKPFDFEKFSWNTVSQQTYNIYKELLKE